ncbi:hypothetical protein L6E12_15115 [Actinokineospora sp. PR83]|uniref:hypothetical protein n=1 Tax=Actinokineospora sp. PR83 TaxID=2884908 RepID=UPI001F2E4EB2|nr:hypothetical protein [Actinokineospora sp. PR83]MCG8917119.1 hypothetical protein [Actinokineospora sp. PR83]
MNEPRIELTLADFSEYENALESLSRDLEVSGCDLEQKTGDETPTTKGGELITGVLLSLGSLKITHAVFISTLRTWLNRPRQQRISAKIESESGTKTVVIEADGLGSEEFISSVTEVLKRIPDKN